MTGEPIEYECIDEAQTIALGARLGRLLRAGDVVALHGELGAGKTRFVRGLARGMGLDESRVCSPTFVIANLYESPAGAAGLAHVDAYRLREADDLAAVGWDRIFDGRRVVAVEWPERVEAALPAERIEVRLEHAGEASRRVRIVWPGSDRVEEPGAGTSAPGRRVCPTCGGPAALDSSSAPFCSERCRLADLSKWFGGRYGISRPIEEHDAE